MTDATTLDAQAAFSGTREVDPRYALDEGKLGTIGLVEIYCYYHMRAKANPPDSTPPTNLSNTST